MIKANPGDSLKKIVLENSQEEPLKSLGLSEFAGVVDAALKAMPADEARKFRNHVIEALRSKRRE